MIPNETTVELLQAQIEELNARIESLEHTYQVAPQMPKTMVISDSFLKRAFAIWGHNFVGALIIFIPIYALVILGIIVGAFATL